MSNLYDLLDRSTKRYPDNTALVFKERAIPYSLLKDATDRLASGIQKLGIRPGDRVALMLPNIPHFPMCYFALLKIGAVVVPVATHCTNEEIHHQLEEAEVRGIMYWEGYRENVILVVHGLERCQKRVVLGEKAAAGEIRMNYLMETNEPLQQTHPSFPEDTAVIVYTDRMKGRSKGVELMHQNLISNVTACAQVFKINAEDGTVGAIPFYHMLGQTLIMNLFLSAGARIVLMPAFQSDLFCQAFRQHRLTCCIVVPHMVESILRSENVDPVDLASVRICLSCGDALKQEILEAFKRKFKIRILEGYGLTEASPMVSFNSPIGERKAGSIGVTLPGIEIKIVDENDTEIIPGKIGEIVVQGPNVMKGYLNRPEASKEALRDGWLRTGDLALLDDNGDATVVAHKRNLIVKSGFVIYPNGVENVLNTHPKVAESVIVGLPDPVQGEEIHACVVLKDGESSNATEITEFLKEQIPVYQFPKTVLFVPSLPKGPTGRVIRDQVKQMLLDQEIPKKQ